jgi:hypothetical protein
MKWRLINTVGGDVLDAPRTMNLNFLYGDIQTYYYNGLIFFAVCSRGVEDVAPYKFYANISHGQIKN